MKNVVLFIKKIFLISALVLFACEQNSPSELQKTQTKLNLVTQKISAVKAKKISLVLTYLQQKGLFNGNVLVVEKGKEIYKASLGYANFRDNTPLNFRTVFRIASISKQFTAVCILILSEQGKLRVDDKVQTHIPEFPYKDITIRHLLTHTSGLPEYLTTFRADSLGTYARNMDIINWLINDMPATSFEAGTQFSYNNTGYIVLAEIVSRISAMPFSLFLKKNIFEPLDLEDTYLLDYSQELTETNRAWGFDQTHTQLQEDNWFNYMHGDGGMFSSLDDLQKWDKALYSQKLISFPTLFQAYKPFKFPNQESSYYGFGMYMKDDLPGIYHYGNWLGFRTYISRFLYDRHCVVVLSNNSCTLIEPICQMIENILYNRPYKIPK